MSKEFLPTNNHAPSISTFTMSVSFSSHYKTQGVHGFYVENAETYKNPHEPGIRKCLQSILDAAFSTIKPASPDDTEPLGLVDVAAGGGEATAAAGQWLAAKGNGVKIRALGLDPYTYKLFQQKTKARALPWGFREILEGRLLESIPSPAAIEVELEDARRAEEERFRKEAEELEMEKEIERVVEEMERKKAEREAAIAAYTGSTTEPAEEEQTETVEELRERLAVEYAEKTKRTEQVQVVQPKPDAGPTRPAPIFDIAVISFALHLLPQEELYQTMIMLSQSARYLIILAPNRGHLERIETRTGWDLVAPHEMNINTKDKSFDGKWFWSRDYRGERVGGGIWRSWNLS